MVLGGKGFIGKYIVRILENNGIETYTYGRNPGGKKHFRGSILDFDTLKKALKDIDVVVNTVGLSPIGRYSLNRYRRIHVEGISTILEAIEYNKIKRIVHISALNIDKFPVTNYDKTKLEAETLIKKSGLLYSIIRPSIVFESGADMFELFDSMGILRIMIIPKLGTCIQPVSATNLAYVVLGQLEKSDNSLIELVGPQKYTFGDFLRLYAEDKRLFKLVIPQKLAKVGIVLLSWVPFVGLNRELFKQLQKDSTVKFSAGKLVQGTTDFEQWLKTV